MDREIKFKGKRINHSKWIYGGCTKGIDHISDKRRKERFYIGYMPIYIEEVYPETVCQYTGLKDIEGNKIFEGDLVEWEDVTGYEDGAGCIEWEPSHAGWFVVNDTTDIFDTVYDFDNCLRIIGNKFDNPQLLKEMK